MKITLSFDQLRYAILEKIAEINKISISKLCKMLIFQALQDCLKEPQKLKLNAGLRFGICTILLDEYRKLEEIERRNWKSYLRSHEEAYGLVNTSEGDKLERIKQLAKRSPKLAKFIENHFNTIRLLNKLREQILEEREKCLRELGEYKNLDEILREAEKIANLEALSYLRIKPDPKRNPVF